MCTTSSYNNISRSRKISQNKAITNTLFNKSNDGNNSFHYEDRLTNNDVKFSILADIGSSSFIYDMHNIKEMFIFPKIWYRRSLARRLFFGDETYNNMKQNGDETILTYQNINEENNTMNDNDLIEIKRRNFY